MKYIFLIIGIFYGFVAESKSYLKVELEAVEHVVIFDGTLYKANGKFEGEVVAGKHAISILKHQYDVESGKVKTDIIYEGVLDLSDNMFYVYKLSNIYLNFVSVNVYSPVEEIATTGNNVSVSNNTEMNVPTNAVAMDENNFQLFLKKLKDKGFEDQKKDFIKSTSKNNWFNSDQVLTILQDLSFENSKVEMAKHLYTKTIDKNNYFKVYEAFNFSSSERALQDFIDGK